MENLQQEPSTHEEFPSLDQEQDPEVFFQPSQAQVVQTCSCPTYKVLRWIGK